MGVVIIGFTSCNPGNLNKIDFDVDMLIIGGGGAGANAALWAVKNGVKAENILIATKLRMGDSNTTMAQGGIQAAVREVDSPSIHYLDAIGGGHYENDPPLARRLVRDAPLVLEWYEKLGMMFDKFEDGTMDAIHGGGTSRKRMHFAKDFTGAEIMKTLRDEVFNHEIPIIEFCPAVELIKDDKGQVAGAVLLNLDSKEYITVKAKATVVTTGGFGRLHIQGFPTSNHYGATFDGCVMGYRAGAPLKLMKSVQYHPTGAAFPEQIVGLLVTEKVRGKGAQVLNKTGEQVALPPEYARALYAYGSLLTPLQPIKEIVPWLQVRLWAMVARALAARGPLINQRPIALAAARDDHDSVCLLMNNDCRVRMFAGSC